MGKPFGLLQRIFSFSRGSKRSGTNFDPLNTNEHGQQPDGHDPDETLHFTGSVRTTGGIGGLGLGITNAASEMSRSNTVVTMQKGGERGLRKRLLRRASLSASDLLSWGYEKASRHETRVASEGGGGRNHPAHPNDIKSHNESAELGQNTNYNNRVVQGLALSGGGSKRGKRGDNSLRPQDNEEFTRLLRTSSSNYRIISETDYRDMTPLEHPINTVALSHSPSIHLLSSSTRSNPPTSLTAQPQPGLKAFPPQHTPATLSHIPSLTSTTSTSTYKVTIHRRRIHSRTSFPEANRALDHLHSSSPATAYSTPSASPRSSSDLPERAICRNVPVKPSAIPKIRDQSRLPRTSTMPSPPKQQQSYRKEVPPSMLPRRFSKRQPLTQKVLHEEAVVRRSAVVNSQLYPVAPLMTVPPPSRRSTSLSLGTGYIIGTNAVDQTDKPSVKLLHSHGGNSTTNMLENTFRYMTPLKGSACSVTTEDAYDGLMRGDENLVLADTRTSPAMSTLTKVSVKNTPIKTRNVLKKKRRESQACLAPTSDVSAKAASIRSGKGRDGDESRSEKNGSHSNLRSALGVIHAVEGVIERLHGSAVGEEALGPSRRHHVEGDIVLANKIPSTQRLNTSQATPLPMRHNSRLFDQPHLRKSRASADPKHITPSTHRKIAPETPRDYARLAQLRRDASVVSLLDMYQADGTLKVGAFSNSPPAKSLQRDVSGKEHMSARQPVIQKEIKAEKGNGLREVDPESRSAQMRRVYVEALGEPSHGLPQSKPFAQSSKAFTPEFASLNHLTSAKCPVKPIIQASSSDESSSPSPSPTSPPENHHRSSKFFAEPVKTISSDSSAGEAGLEHGSLSSEHETSGMLVDSSLFVEPGSRAYFNDTSCESTPAVESPEDATKWSSYSMQEDNYSKIDHGGVSVAGEIIPRSPNRRASEFFAFLDPIVALGDESFEAGTLSAKEEVAFFSNRMAGGSQSSRAQRKHTHIPPRLTPTISTPFSSSSPSKRPVGPRAATCSDLTHVSSTKERSSFLTSSSSDGTSKSSSGNIPTSPLPSPLLGSPEALTGVTFASDSFASQNTTDRSLYRGIYKYLNETPSIAGRSKVKETTVRDSLVIFPKGPASTDKRNPFLITPVNVDKSLPMTPSSAASSEADSAAEWAKYTRNFMSLPISPLAPATGSSNSIVANPSKSPVPPSSPCKPKSSVKDRIAMWESTKPLEIDEDGLQRRFSHSKHLNPSGRSVKWSEDTSQERRTGLGDGRAFNTSLNTGRMYGPRDPSPTKKPTNKPAFQVSERPIIPNKDTKLTGFTHGYPFSQDLFPAILSPGGPAVARPNSLLQTPQRNTTRNDPSPASSSKLGVYGREIMALARLKSSAHMNHDDGKPL